MITWHRYSRIYAMLKNAGHSPAKAAEIILDACRGQRHARSWIRTLFAGRHS